MIFDDPRQIARGLVAFTLQSRVSMYRSDVKLRTKPASAAANTMAKTSPVTRRAALVPSIAPSVAKQIRLYSA